MKVIREHAEARWLPSRFHLATARLVAFAVFRLLRPRREPGLILALDRHQSAAETYATAVAITTVSTCYVAASLADVLHPLAAWIVAFPVAVIALQIWMNVSAVAAALLRLNRPMRINSTFVMVTLIAISAYVALSDRWVRYVGRAFLVLMAVNAVAALIAWPLRHKFRELEERYEAAA